MEILLKEKSWNIKISKSFWNWGDIQDPLKFSIVSLKFFNYVDWIISNLEINIYTNI